jgi:hypothetical protein
MLVHICCSVDSHYFLQKLQQQNPDEKILGYFYNPNIHPLNEYKLRLMDVTRSCDMLHIPLIVGEYAYDEWFCNTKSLASEPEKGKRCDVCFEHRFEESAKKAHELGIKQFTSTLLVSPKKSYEQLLKSARKIASKYGVEFVAIDFKKSGGTSEQNRLAKTDKLYRQNYCGCTYALKNQREQKQKPAYELFNSIEYGDEPNSLENRMRMYEQRMDLEAKEIGYEIIKKKALNYRLRHAVVKDAKGVIASFVLPYSIIESGHSKGRVEKVLANVAYFNRDEIKFCDISYFNTIASTNFYSVTQLMRAKVEYEKLLKVRKHIVGEYDLSPIIIVNSLPAQKLHVQIDATCFFDSVEELKPHAAY